MEIFTRKKRVNSLIIALDKAVVFLNSNDRNCGLSDLFNSTREFAAALEIHKELLAKRDFSRLDELAVWFAPTSVWDDAIGENELANEIESLIKSLRRK